MKTIVLNYFKQSALVSNTQQAVEFINSLPGITANQTTVDNLDNFFAGTNKYPLKEIATTGCGPNRIMVYDALAETLDAHNEIVEANKKAKRDAYENAQNEYVEGVYEVDLKIIRLEGRAFYKTVKINATSLKDSKQKAMVEFWENNTTNAIQVLACSSVLLKEKFD